MHPNHHPAKEALSELHREYPELQKTIDAIAIDTSPRRETWPRNVLLPSELWHAIAAHLLSIDPQQLGRNPLLETKHRTDIANLADRIRTLGTWGKTQGIYRFDPQVYEEVAGTSLQGDLPAQCLQRLPEWCIYVETPDQPTLAGDNVRARGAWVSIGYSLDDGNHDSATRLLISPDIILPEGFPAHMRNQFTSTLELPLSEGKSLGQLLNEAYERDFQTLQRKQPSFTSDFHDVLPEQIAFMHRVVSMTLYICTQNDLHNSRTAQTIPELPQPQRTKKGARLFIPDAPQTWDVGVRMGTAIRAAQAAMDSSPSAGDGSATVRPHIRRAHWHSFHTGPRKTPDGQEIPASQRPVSVKWLPSIPVNLPEDVPEHALPAVIHKASKTAPTGPSFDR